MNELGTRWVAKTTRVDVDTGECLTKHQAETQYIKIKTTKHATRNKLGTRGTIHYTICYKRSQQGNLFE